MIFVDTGAFVARHLPRDQYHSVAIAAWRELERGTERCVTTNHVVDETVTLLARWAGSRFSAGRGRALLSSHQLEIVRPEADLETDAIGWLERFEYQALSYTDCLSFAVMKKAGITRAFTFDGHFRIAGFATWPE
jgi:predicted nucleic acid-binding protein